MNWGQSQRCRTMSWGSGIPISERWELAVVQFYLQLLGSAPGPSSALLRVVGYNPPSFHCPPQAATHPLHIAMFRAQVPTLHQ